MEALLLVGRVVVEDGGRSADDFFFGSVCLFLNLQALFECFFFFYFLCFFFLFSFFFPFKKVQLKPELKTHEGVICLWTSYYRTVLCLIWTFIQYTR